MAEIVLKDRNGSPITYSGVSGVNLRLTDGSEQTFATGKPVHKTIDLDFSNTYEGYTYVSPADGELFSLVMIKKPEMLVPGNIAEGVNIAGIVGTLVGGGGGDIKIATGTITGATVKTVYHTLGVVPDIVLVFVQASNTSIGGVYSMHCAIGFSTAFIEANPDITPSFLSYMYSASVAKTLNSTIPIDGSHGNAVGFIRGANNSSFSVGNSGNYPRLQSNKTYQWVAIGGLT